MSTLFGSLNVARQSLHNMQLGITVAGHNMANATTEGYNRQKVVISSEKQSNGAHVLGAGAYVNQVQRVHDVLLENRIQDHQSDTGLLESQKEMLDFMESSLGQFIDRQSMSVEGTSASQGIGTPSSIAEYLDQFFNSISSLSNDPTSSALRQELVNNANSLTNKLNGNIQAVDTLQSQILNEVTNTVEEINRLITQISELNYDIVSDEKAHRGESNDLRDKRQVKVEELAELINIDKTVDSDGLMTIYLDGVQMSGLKTSEKQIESFIKPDGSIGLRTVGDEQETGFTSGRLAGLSRVRDVILPDLKTKFDTFASTLISEVNAVYQTGTDLLGNSGGNFFEGTNASDIKINPDVMDNPAKIQGSLDGEKGDNTIFLRLFDLSNKELPSLNNLTFSENYADITGNFGNTIKAIEDSIEDNSAVGDMLAKKRDSISGVSLDEEMTNLIQFQRAYQASARIINTLDEMISTAINLGR